MSKSRDYHLMELAIARDSRDPRRSLPPIAARHRRVLDIGCGAGQTLIASHLPAGTLGVGIDVEHEALRLGRELGPALHFLRARGESLPFADAVFDLVVCRVALPYMHIGRAVTEMARVLAPGGDAWLTMHPWRMTARELLAAITSWRPKLAAHRMYVLASSTLLHVTGRQLAWPFGGGGYESFQTVGGIRRALQAAGFESVHIDRGRPFLATATRVFRRTS